MPTYDPQARARLTAALVAARAEGVTLDALAARPGWPSRPTLRKWLRESPDLADRAEAGLRAHRRRRAADPWPFDPAAADRFVAHVRAGEPIGRLIREPGLPHRRALTHWKAAHPDFAARLAEACAHADHARRHDRVRNRHRRRANLPFSQDVAERILLAALAGATLPDLARHPDLPSRTGLRRWRRAVAPFDAALREALAEGHRARGRARVDAHCTARLTDQIQTRIIAGGSLHGLARAPDMPGLYCLYKWVRDRPDFARAVALACRLRDDLYRETILDHCPGLIRPPPNSEAMALAKRLGQLNPHPGERRPEAAAGYEV